MLLLPHAKPVLPRGWEPSSTQRLFSIRWIHIALLNKCNRGPANNLDNDIDSGVHTAEGRLQPVEPESQPVDKRARLNEQVVEKACIQLPCILTFVDPPSASC